MNISLSIRNLNNRTRIARADDNFIINDLTALMINAKNEKNDYVIDNLRNGPVDKLFRFRRSDGILIMPYEAVLGQTYSLYCLTNNTPNHIWENCNGNKLYISLGPYDRLTNNNPTAIEYINPIPRTVDYFHTFVLNYNTTSLYIYGSDVGDNIDRTEFYYARIAIKYSYTPI